MKNYFMLSSVKSGWETLLGGIRSVSVVAREDGATKIQLEATNTTVLEFHTDSSSD